MAQVTAASNADDEVAEANACEGARDNLAAETYPPSSVIQARSPPIVILL